MDEDDEVLWASRDEAELERLRHNDESLGDSGYWIAARTVLPAAEVLRRVREVLLIALDFHEAGPCPDARTLGFPDWFVASFPPASWRDGEFVKGPGYEQWYANAPSYVRGRIDRNGGAWVLQDWLECMRQSDQREWRWLGGRAESEDRVVVTLDVASWPTPFGTIDSLLRMAGGAEIEHCL